MRIRRKPESTRDGKKKRRVEPLSLQFAVILLFEDSPFPLPVPVKSEPITSKPSFVSLIFAPSELKHHRGVYVIGCFRAEYPCRPAAYGCGYKGSVGEGFDGIAFMHPLRGWGLIVTIILLLRHSAYLSSAAPRRLFAFSVYAPQELPQIFLILISGFCIPASIKAEKSAKLIDLRKQSPISFIKTAVILSPLRFLSEKAACDISPADGSVTSLSSHASIASLTSHTQSSEQIPAEFEAAAITRSPATERPWL